MLGDVSGVKAIYIVTGYTDKGDGLPTEYLKRESKGTGRHCVAI